MRLPDGDTTDAYPRPVAAAVERLLHNGISGPYALALGGEMYQQVVETAEHGGYPLLDHLRKILEGPIVWTPGVRGAIVLSLRGGDFLFESGQDLSIGYASHDREAVQLYLEESFAFHVATPEAAVVLEAASLGHMRRLRLSRSSAGDRRILGESGRHLPDDLRQVAVGADRLTLPVGPGVCPRPASSSKASSQPRS